MNKLTAIKIKYDDGTYSDEIPVSVLSENVEWDNTHTLVDVLGSIDVDAKGTIQDQIDRLSNNNTQFDTQLASINDDLNDFVTNFTNVLGNGAGAHNSIYRGKDLGTSVTYKQWAAIKAGTFDDLYIGDYWTIGGVNYRIAAFDYYLHTGDTECTAHHVVIVPDTTLYDAQMNTSKVVTGAYVGSAMHTSNLATAKATINNAFGSSHVLNHRNHLQNATTDGYETGGAWYDSTVELMSEQNLYGGKIFKSCTQGSNWANLYTIDKSQYPLFAMDPTKINTREDYWLRDVANSTGFTCCNSYGSVLCFSPSDSHGVRPAFCIYQS